MHIIVKRTEGDFAVVEFPDTNTTDVPLSDLPKGVKPGDCFSYSDGHYIYDPDETIKRQKEITRNTQYLQTDNFHLSNYSLDHFVAPGLSKLTFNNVPVLLMEQQEYWVRNFILNTMFGGRIDLHWRPHLYNFLRKVEAAFYEYAHARSTLDEYFLIGKDAISKYLLAVQHFESCLALTYQAYMLIKNILKKDKFFKTDDDSTLDRLNKLYNQSKHIEDKLSNGQDLNNILLPIWITNIGIESPKAVLSFNELVELLTELGETAQHLSALQDRSKK